MAIRRAAMGRFLDDDLFLFPVRSRLGVMRDRHVMCRLLGCRRLAMFSRIAGRVICGSIVARITMRHSCRIYMIFRRRLVTLCHGTMTFGRRGITLCCGGLTFCRGFVATETDHAHQRGHPALAFFRTMLGNRRFLAMLAGGGRPR